MDICLMINRVVHSYIHDLPEVTHNAYGYFGYDKPVVEERVNRGDIKIPYYSAKDFTDPMYQAIITSALSQVNPILEKYSQKVAYEDALHTAIRNTGNGVFDGKINANCYNVLLNAMLQTRSAASKKKEAPKEAPKKIPERTLRELGLKRKDVSQKSQRHPHQIVKERGQVVIEKKKDQ